MGTTLPSVKNISLSMLKQLQQQNWYPIKQLAELCIYPKAENL